MSFLNFIILIFFGVVSIVAIVNIYNYNVEKKICLKNKVLPIKFKSFLSFYSIAPDKWILTGDQIEQCVKKSLLEFIDVAYVKNAYNARFCREDIELFRFLNPIDRWKFNKWLKNKKLQNLKDKANEDLLDVMNAIQMDITDYENKYYLEMNQSLEDNRKHKEKVQKDFEEMKKGYK